MLAARASRLRSPPMSSHVPLSRRVYLDIAASFTPRKRLYKTLLARPRGLGPTCGQTKGQRRYRLCPSTDGPLVRLPSLRRSRADNQPTLSKGGPIIGRSVLVRKRSSSHALEYRCLSTTCQPWQPVQVCAAQQHPL